MLLQLSAVVHAQTGPISGIQSDLSRYDPGDPVQFDLDLEGPISGTQQLVVRYRYLSDVVQTQTVPVTSSTVSWSWNPPSTDYRGYLAEVEVVDNNAVQGRSAIAVDVSSDWAKFPRYGFLSKYSPLTDQNMSAVMSELNRYHINGLQFYDWHSDHHQPLEGTAESPAASWLDIANRTNYFSTVSGYIEKAHQRNMVAMSYNLANGALEGAAADGVQEAWYLYTDAAATTKDKHDLPAGWKSDIYLVNPANPDWQSYIAANTADAFQALPFDGWHIDQLGDRGNVYDYNHNPVNLANTLGPFLDSMKSSLNKRLVVSAPNQYGQSQIGGSDVEFLYTEVWDPHSGFNDLAGIILANNALGNQQLNTVLAAYVNYNAADSPGTFNAPAVLLADAVTFAFGGAHLELGEHMLSREYFPDDKLQMSSDLQDSLTGYYDFLVGYQNLLRDGGDFGTNELTSGSAPVSMWPAQQGDVAVVNKTVGNKEIFHLINFADAAHMNWRDLDRTQTEPSPISGIDLRFLSSKPIGKLWAVSPDADAGLPVELSFSQAPNGRVDFTLPSLKYWSMVVAESVAGPWTMGADDAAQAAYAGGASGWDDGDDGGNGFGPWKLLAETNGGFAGFYAADDASGPGGDRGIDNAGTPDRATGVVWASYANQGSGDNKATAFRTFDTSLDGEGDGFSLTLENGVVDVGGKVGVALRSGNASANADDYATDARFELLFAGGSGNYTIVDGEGTLDTGVGFTFFGIDLEFTLSGADTYDLNIYRYDEPNDASPTLTQISGRTLAGAGPLDSFALFNLGGINQSDVYFNNLAYMAVAMQGLAGDYNDNGVVDAADYTVWRDAMEAGATELLNDSTPGSVDESDFLYWRSHFGESTGQGAAAAGGSQTLVPEPQAICLWSLAACGIGLLRPAAGVLYHP